MGSAEARLDCNGINLEQAAEKRELLKKFCMDHPEFRVKDFHYYERIGMQADEQTITLLQDILKSLDKIGKAGE